MFEDNAYVNLSLAYEVGLQRPWREHTDWKEEVRLRLLKRIIFIYLRMHLLFQNIYIYFKENERNKRKVGYLQTFGASNCGDFKHPSPRGNWRGKIQLLQLLELCFSWEINLQCLLWRFWTQCDNDGFYLSQISLSLFFSLSVLFYKLLAL